MIAWPRCGCSAGGCLQLGNLMPPCEESSSWWGRSLCVAVRGGAGCVQIRASVPIQLWRKRQETHPTEPHRRPVLSHIAPLHVGRFGVGHFVWAAAPVAHRHVSQTLDGRWPAPFGPYVLATEGDSWVSSVSLCVGYLVSLCGCRGVSAVVLSGPLRSPGRGFKTHPKTIGDRHGHARMFRDTPTHFSTPDRGCLGMLSSGPGQTGQFRPFFFFLWRKKGPNYGFLAAVARPAASSRQQPWHIPPGYPYPP